MSEAFELFQKGKRHLADGMPAQATVSLERAKRHEPDKASIREALGIAYFRLRRFEEAETEFRAMIEITPTDAYGYYGLGRSLARLGQSAEASGQLKLARMLSPLEPPPDDLSGSFSDSFRPRAGLPRAS
ncbi:MAG: tetratricopeptide repeat protein [Gaiellaceae bacterium]